MSQRENKIDHAATIALGELGVNKPFKAEDLTALLKALEEFGISEFELEQGDLKLRLKRGTTGKFSVAGDQVSPTIALREQAPPIDSGPTRDAMEIKREVVLSVLEGKKKGTSDLKEIKSPMVGTFYRRPSVDAKPYVDLGDWVKPGKVLCIVEAMKLMNEIESDVAGRIAEVCLEDGQMAEYGEVLFRIDTSAQE